MKDADDPYVGGRPSHWNDDFHGQRERMVRKTVADVETHNAAAVDEGVLLGAELAMKMAKTRQPLAQDVVNEIRDMLARRRSTKTLATPKDGRINGR